MFTKFRKSGPTPIETRMFIRFGEGNSISFSSALCYAVIEKNESDACKFDIWVDKEARLVGICPSDQGEYLMKTIPSCVGGSEFVRSYRPVMQTRLHVKWLEGDDAVARPAMWIARLDGGEWEED